MRKILIFGGTRYFGKKLVELLLQEDEHDVTIATRGNSPVIFSKRIKHLTLDRTNRADLLALTSRGDWDLVYDNICYSSDDAQIAVDAFEGRVGQYIMTSTLSVYEPLGRAVIEDDFNPYSYPIKKGASSDFAYSEGKRQAEAVLFQKAHFPVQAMRIPIVLGTDDYTKRLHFHVHRIQKGTPMGVPNLDARLSFISSNEAAEFLAWLGQGLVKGPVNAASEGSISVRQIVRTIEEATGRTAIIKGETGPENQSPFGVPADWLMDTSKAVRAGYRFTPLASWFPKLVQAIADGHA